MATKKGVVLANDASIKRDGEVVGSWTQDDEGNFVATLDDTDRTPTESSKKHLRSAVTRVLLTLDMADNEEEGRFQVRTFPNGLTNPEDAEVDYFTERQLRGRVRKVLNTDVQVHVFVQGGGMAPVSKSWAWKTLMNGFDAWCWYISQSADTATVSVMGRKDPFFLDPRPVLEIHERFERTEDASEQEEEVTEEVTA